MQILATAELSIYLKVIIAIVSTKKNRMPIEIGGADANEIS